MNLLSTRATAVMTNVPGPRERLHFLGVALRQIMFWVPRAGDVSLGVSIKSYAGEVLLGLATDATLVPDPGLIIDASAWVEVIEERNQEKANDAIQP